MNFSKLYKKTAPLELFLYFCLYFTRWRFFCQLPCQIVLSVLY